MISVRRTVVGALCLPLLLLGACGDGDSDADTPGTPAPSETPSATASPTDSERPELGPTEFPAEEFTAEEFVRAWFDAYNELTLTGDGNALRAMSAEDCAGCTEIADTYEEVYAAGGMIIKDGEPNIIKDVSEEESPVADVRLIVDFVSNAGRSVAHADAEEIEFAADEFAWVLDLAVKGGQWNVVVLGVEG